MKIERRSLTLEDVRAGIAAFEHAYGVPTATLERAFVAEQQVEETPEYVRWSMLRSALLLMEGRAQAHHA